MDTLTLDGSGSGVANIPITPGLRYGIAWASSEGLDQGTMNFYQKAGGTLVPLRITPGEAFTVELSEVNSDSYEFAATLGSLCITISGGNANHTLEYAVTPMVP